MKVQDLIKQLSLLDPELPVWLHAPAEGDSESCINARPQDFYLDQRYPALVIFS